MLCPAGKYQESAGQETCELCLENHFCIEGAATSAMCENGKYPDSTSTCADCLAGFKCPDGHFLKCNINFPIPFYYSIYMSLTSKYIVHVGPTGYYSGIGQTSCSPCPAGSFCPEGKFSIKVLCYYYKINKLILRSLRSY
jgi:hypothetical protein